MGFVSRLINWLLSLLGIRQRAASQVSQFVSQQMSPPAQQLPQPGQPRVLSDAERAQIRNNAVQGLGDVQGAENIHVFGSGAGSKVVRSENGADLVEEDGKQQWVNRVNDEVPRQQWRDEWGPLSGATALEDFVFHEMEFDHTRAGDPLGAEKKLQAFGYRDAGHFFYVRATVLKHFGTQHGPNVGDATFSSQEFNSAGLKAAARQRDEKMKATVAANPELLSPVEGVSVEMYAQLAARVAQQMPQDQFLALLAQHGLDYATWDRAAKVWNDRMSKDTTATIATLYGKAFMNSGQGQYGAAGAAAAGTNWNGTAAGGAEPMPFEKMCEISGAMAAWAKSGQDVNALLKSKFNMVAADWSNVSTWWFSQMTADLTKFNEYNAKMAQYEQQYMGAQVRHDQDIAF